MEQNKKMNRKDIAVLLIITVLYSIVSFLGIGDTSVPQTGPDMGSGEKREMISYISLEKETELAELRLFKGLGVCGITVYKSDDGGESWTEIVRHAFDGVYKWEAVPLSESASLLCLSVGGDGELELFEAAFISSDGSLVSVKTDKNALFDEQELVPAYPGYSNGMYFDEIYHARTAYEHLNGMAPFEITHPPLGKELISFGIALFGMDPFGWRVMGNVFGIAMLAVLYAFAKRLFASTFFAAASTILFALDFMHFTQTRIALIDSFAVFFIILMYYLMFIYYDSDPTSLSYKRSLAVLCACGIVFGLAVSVKWNSVYGGIGLAVLFALALIRREKHGKDRLKTCLWCVLFFIAIPLVIYFISYFPYFIADPENSPLKIFIDNQVYMLNYHGGLETTHEFESKWYTWPLIFRPMWYYGSKTLAYNGLCSTIVAMGNPAVWWTGSTALILLLFKRRKSRSEWFIIIGMLSQFLPWALISRSTFIYHFFASVPFIILALTSLLKSLSERYKRCRVILPAVLCAALVLFIMFYPVISGSVADREYVLNALKWFDTWKLCY